MALFPLSASGQVRNREAGSQPSAPRPKARSVPPTRSGAPVTQTESGPYSSPRVRPGTPRSPDDSPSRREPAQVAARPRSDYEQNDQINEVSRESTNRAQPDQDRLDETDADLTPEERTNIAVYERSHRSVVNITTRTSRDALLLFEVSAEGSGSGTVIDEQGHILTNHHVIEGSQRIKVTLFSGETFDAVVVGYDPPNDIAIIKIDAPKEQLFPVDFGTSKGLRVGQHIYAIGNPFGLEGTLTRGIISSLNRSLPSKDGRTLKSIIQIDAALNRGNSGGPLLNSRGLLIGMNTAIASSTGENTGVGFAIPADTIRRVAAQLIEFGRVTRASLGITRVYQNDSGLLIATMSKGGPAELAGLRGFRVVKETKRRGPFSYEDKSIDRSYADRIVAVDAENVRTADDLLNAIESKRPGEEVALRIIRDGRETVVRVRLGAED